MSKSFFIRHTKERGHNRELYFTPKDVIKKIVESLLLNYPILKDRVWIDPCAADGRWEDVIKTYGIECYSYDTNPLSNNVVKQDFLTTTSYNTNQPFFIGNPPFSLLKKFIAQALTFSPFCYFLGGSQIITNTLSSYVKLLHRFEGFEGNQKDKRSKIIFTDTLNEEVLIWCCGALFTSFPQNKFKIVQTKTDFSFRVSIKNYCEADDRVVIIGK